MVMTSPTMDYAKVELNAQIQFYADFDVQRPKFNFRATWDDDIGDWWIHIGDRKFRGEVHASDLTNEEIEDLIRGLRRNDSTSDDEDSTDEEDTDDTNEFSS